MVIKKFAHRLQCLRCFLLADDIKCGASCQQVRCKLIFQNFYLQSVDNKFAKFFFPEFMQFSAGLMRLDDKLASSE